MLYYYANHILRELGFFQCCATFQLLISSGEHKPFHSLLKTGNYVLQIVFLEIFELWGDVLRESRAHRSPHRTQPSPLPFSLLPEGRSLLWGSRVEM